MAGDDHVQAPPFRRIAFSAGGLLQLTNVGSLYAFPLWLIYFKRVFEISQTQANTIGISIYAGVSFVGLPLSLFIVPKLTATKVTAICSVVPLIGFVMMYCVARGFMGHHVGAFIALLLSMLLISAPLGIMYSLVYDVMSDHYGPKEVIFVNGMISSSFALGGVIAGSLLYWTDLGLDGNLFIISVFQAATLPFIVLSVHAGTDGYVSPNSVPDERAPVQGANRTEQSPLLRPGPQHEEDPKSLQVYLKTTLSSSKYLHAALIIFCKTGVGTVFTTNIGAVVAATLSPNASDEDVDDKVALILICLNFAQLFGRVLFTTLSLCEGNPNAWTLNAVYGVAIVYIGCFAARIYLPFTFDNLVINTCVLGVAYGLMWSTTSAMAKFVPLPKNVGRSLVMTNPVGVMGTVIFNTLAGMSYDRHATDNHECYGEKCFRDTDLIMIGLSGFVFVLALLRRYLGIPDKDGIWPHGGW